MNITSLIERVLRHFQLIVQEEQNVDLKRQQLVCQKGIDIKQLYESIAMPNFNYQSLNSFLNHYQIEHDDQFVNSFLYRYTNLTGFEMNYSNFLDFVMPCEDDDLYQITKNKEHLGGARTIFSQIICQSLFDLFYSEVHYHFEIERSKKELFRDFEYGLLVFPLCQYKYIDKQNLECLNLNNNDLNRLWRRLNCMQRKLYINSNQKCRNLKSLLFPEDYMEHLKLIKQPIIIDENALHQFIIQRQYTKNTRIEDFIECPKNKTCQFYQNYDNTKTYNSDKFMIEYNKLY